MPLRQDMVIYRIKWNYLRVVNHGISGLFCLCDGRILKASLLDSLEEPGILFVFEFASLVSLSSLYSTELSSMIVASFLLLYCFLIKTSFAVLYCGFVSVHTSPRSLNHNPVAFRGC